MRIGILGAGGVGGYFGGKLAHAGNDVAFLARGEHLTAIREKGLWVKSIKGDFKVNSVNATDNISLLGVKDLIIVAVKAWQVREVASDLSRIMDSHTVVIPLENGILAAEELQESINKGNIIGGLCRIFSKIEAPGIIDHMGYDPLIIFGELDNADTERTRKLKELFDDAGINSRRAEDIQAELWKKFLSICAGGVLAVTRSSYGEVRELEETRKLMIGVFEEIFRLSQKAGINIEPDIVDKALALVDSFPHNTTTSLARDIWEGKPSEIEYQNGTVVRMAEKLGVDVPINRFIYHCILPMELKARNRKQLV